VRGDLAFQDYAVSTWFMHIRSIVEARQDLFDRNSNSADLDYRPLQEKICKELDIFVNFYPESFPADRILDQSRVDCEFFRDYSFYENLLRIWNHICSEQRKDFVSRNNVSLEKLSKTLQRNRQLLESLSSKSSIDLSMRYGDYPFRCPKVLCFYFHEGFKDAKVRDNHIKRHERPFHCSVDNCSTNGLGFASNNALEKHMRTFHPDQCDLSESFVQLSRRNVEHARWPCSLCSKSFVRQSILKDHMNNHKGERLM
jgi:hypothetical protein